MWDIAFMAELGEAWAAREITQRRAEEAQLGGLLPAERCPWDPKSPLPASHRPLWELGRGGTPTEAGSGGSSWGWVLIYCPGKLVQRGKAGVEPLFSPCLPPPQLLATSTWGALRSAPSRGSASPRRRRMLLKDRKQIYFRLFSPQINISPSSRGSPSRGKGAQRSPPPASFHGGRNALAKSNQEGSG